MADWITGAGPALDARYIAPGCLFTPTTVGAGVTIGARFEHFPVREANPATHDRRSLELRSTFQAIPAWMFDRI